MFSKKHLLAVLFTLFGFASAQSIVGTWSTPLVDQYGNTHSVLFLIFGADGSYKQYLTTNMGALTYYGSYQLDTSNMVLSFVLNDYDPKEFCSSGFCDPIPPSYPLGQVFSPRIQWVNENLFLMDDVSGPLRYVRQP
jgi:hypothetical protein